MSHDVIIVGAGILGLAHALAAHRMGKSVLVVDRDMAAQGASIRNFGFITVSGQAAGECWQMARRTRDVWAEIAPQAGIPVLQHGLVVAGHRPEAMDVLEAFQKTDMGAECSLLSAGAAREKVAQLHENTRGALWSPHELRVESRDALPKLAAWLAAQGVDFAWETEVLNIGEGHIETRTGRHMAEIVIACPGDNIPFLAPHVSGYNLSRTKLQMMRIAPDHPQTLRHAVMSDLSLARYHGYAALPEADALAIRLDHERPEHREKGVHLIAVQSADGSLVVGDSHEPRLDPFTRGDVDALILQTFDEVMTMGPYTVCENWYGTYPLSPDRWRITHKIDEQTYIAIVTAGCGASTAFAIGETTLNSIYGNTS